MATADGEKDKWELVNDDGFVYKRKIRPRLDPTTLSSSLPPPDPLLEEKSQRERKKRALVKLRKKYQREIDQWEHLSNMLRALQQKAQNQQAREETETKSYDLAVVPPQLPGSSPRRFLDNLLLRAETQEGIIRDASNLCDVAEAICNVQEEHRKQSFVDLPVWASPHELMAYLCEELSETCR